MTRLLVLTAVFAAVMLPVLLPKRTVNSAPVAEVQPKTTAEGGDLNGVPEKAPCGTSWYEHEGRCYTPFVAPAPPPSSLEP